MSSLSFRLEEIYKRAIPGEDFWDLCCDHGYLGSFAYQTKKYKNVFLVDRVPTIIDALKNKFEDLSLHIILSDGKEIPEDLHGNVVIAGVGGMNILNILQSLIEKNRLKAKRLILSPHRDEAEFFTSSLFDRYQKREEFALYERGHLRMVFVYDLEK